VVTSTSSQGQSSFVLQFNLNKSIDAAATDVQTAITQANGQLPTDLPSPPTYSKTNPNDQPIMYIALAPVRSTVGSCMTTPARKRAAHQHSAGRE